MVISVYQPVDKRGKEGTNSVASQQRSLLLQASVPTDNPRVAFRRDLFQTLQSYRRDGFDFLVVGDFNEAYGSDSDRISSIACQFGLINVMNKQHPTLPGSATYARGTKCIDYALGTPHVAETVVAAGYEAFNARFVSDHRGYFIDFNTNALFGSPTQELASYAHRRLRTSNLHQNTAYIEKLYELMQAHNVIERAHRLTHAGDRHTLVEALDRDMTAACLAPEATLPRFGEAAWSSELATARKRTHALGKIFSNVKAGRDTTDLIATTKAIMPTAWVPPTSVQQSSQQWREEKKRTATIAADSINRRDSELKNKIRSLEQSDSANDRETATIIRRLKKAEDIKRLWKKLKSVRQNDNPQGVVCLEIPLHPDTDPK